MKWTRKSTPHLLSVPRRMLRSCQQVCSLDANHTGGIVFKTGHYLGEASVIFVLVINRYVGTGNIMYSDLVSWSSLGFYYSPCAEIGLLQPHILLLWTTAIPQMEESNFIGISWNGCCMTAFLTVLKWLARTEGDGARTEGDQARTEGGGAWQRFRTAWT